MQVDETIERIIVDRGHSDVGGCGRVHLHQDASYEFYLGSRWPQSIKVNSHPVPGFCPPAR
jgi:hypothetical protein